MTDRLLINKWVVLDRLNTLRALADGFAAGAYEDFDRDMFTRLRLDIDEAVKALTTEVQRREGRA